MDDLIGLINDAHFNLVLCGDFNSHSAMWGSVLTDTRGVLLQNWVADHDLRLVNNGTTPTCIRPQGDSVIDFTWVSADLMRHVTEWRVRSDLESLSDHQCVTFGIGSPLNGLRRCPSSPYSRWNAARIDKDKFVESLEWACAVGPSNRELEDPEGWSLWLLRTMQNACDASAPRVGARRPPRETMYWWNNNIAELRHISIKARREWSRIKKRGSPEMVAEKQAIYRSAKKNLGMKIKKAKTNAWNDLLNSINRDPWGLPYRLVLGRLRKSGPGMNESLNPDELCGLLDDLFPSGFELSHIDWATRSWEWSAEWNVTSLKVDTAIREKYRLNTAPGPDGIMTIFWKIIPGVMFPKLADIFTELLRRGCFPAKRKVARLVLIPKGEILLGVPPKAHPICLLDEIGKILERIIAARMKI